MGKVAAAARPIYSEKSEEVHMDDRVRRLESDVAHLRTDGARVENDVREIRVEQKATNEQLADLRTEMRTGFANVQAQFANAGGARERPTFDMWGTCK